MDSILYVAALLCLALVGGWYLGNEASGGSGNWGILAIKAGKQKPKAAPAAKYQTKERVRPAPELSVLEKAASAAPARAPRHADRAKGRFTEKDDRRYRPRSRPLPEEKP
jgi:hypothetical protein